ncbi:hypothetical protein HDV00_006012 [Rhizophlyctis rosea]|nr:hypothetical protein HDV00_006012 [Rhizophlyctis rosea]
MTEDARRTRSDAWDQVKANLTGAQYDAVAVMHTEVLNNVTSLLSRKYAANFIPIDTTDASPQVFTASLPFNRSGLKPTAEFGLVDPYVGVGCYLPVIVFSIAGNWTVLYGNGTQTEYDTAIAAFTNFWRPRMLVRSNSTKLLPLLPITVIDKTIKPYSFDYTIDLPPGTQFASWWLNTPEFAGVSVPRAIRQLSDAVTNLTIASAGTGTTYFTFPEDASLVILIPCNAEAKYQISSVVVRQGGVANVWLDPIYQPATSAAYNLNTDYNLLTTAELETGLNENVITLFGTYVAEVANSVENVEYTPLRYLNYVMSARCLKDLIETRWRATGRPLMMGLVSSQPM